MDGEHGWSVLCKTCRGSQHFRELLSIDSDVIGVGGTSGGGESTVRRALWGHPSYRPIGLRRPLTWGQSDHFRSDCFEVEEEETCRLALRDVEVIVSACLADCVTPNWNCSTACS